MYQFYRFSMLKRRSKLIRTLIVAMVAGAFALSVTTATAVGSTGNHSPSAHVKGIKHLKSYGTKFFAPNGHPATTGWKKCVRMLKPHESAWRKAKQSTRKHWVTEHCHPAKRKPVAKPAPKPVAKPASKPVAKPATSISPSPTAPIPNSGIATAATTGVPSGVSLTAASGMNITKSGTVVDGKDIKGTIWIDADNVTIKNSRIVGKGFSIVQIKDGSTGVRIENVEIDGLGMAGAAGSMGIMGPANVSGSDIKGVENGLTPGSGSVLRGNFVHQLAAPGSPHYDGIQIDGGLSNITIENNSVDLREHGQTSALMIDNYFGPINNITVKGNLLMGGGYTVYSDGQFSGGAITGVSFINNRLGKGHWGYASIVKNSPTWSGNVDHSTGKTVG